MVLKVGTLHSNKPDSYPCAEKNLAVREECLKPGFISEVFSFVSDLSGIEYEIRPLGNNQKLGNLYNGTWTEAHGKLVEGVLDILLLPYFETPIRRRFFQFSYPLYQSRTVFLIRKDNNFMDYSGSLFRVFDIKVWFAICSTLVILSLTSFMITRTLKINGSKVWEVLRFFLNQCYKDLNENSTARALLAMTIYVTYVSTTAKLYPNALLGHLIHVRSSQSFTNFEQLVQNIQEKKLSLVMKKAHWLQSELLHSNLTIFRKLRKATINNPVFYTDEVREMISLLLTGKFALPVDERQQTTKYLCQLTAVKAPDIPQRRVSFMFNKNVTLDRFNLAMMISTGRTERLLFQYHYSSRADYTKQMLDKDFSDEIAACGTNRHRKPLSIQSLNGVFALLAIGLGIAAVFCIFERMTA